MNHEYRPPEPPKIRRKLRLPQMNKANKIARRYIATATARFRPVP